MEINGSAPMVARKQVFIEAGPEAVWKIQSDIDGWEGWQTAITKSQLDGALETGATFKWTSGGFTVTSTVQEVIPQRRLSWTGTGPGSRARHVWNFQPQEGGTLVSTEESMEGWLVSLLRLFMPGFLGDSLDVWLKDLKARAEGSTA